MRRNLIKRGIKRERERREAIDLTFPGQKEDDSPITGGRVQESHGPGAVVAREYDV